MLGALVGDEVEVGEVHGGDDEGDEGVAAVVLCVGEDGEVGLEEFHLCCRDCVSCDDVQRGVLRERTNLASDVGVQAGEDNVAVRKLGGLALAHDEVAKGAHGRGLLPADGIAVFLAGGAGGGADCDELEVGVLREEENEALADGAGAAKDACVIGSCQYLCVFSSLGFIIVVSCAWC